MGEGMHSHFPDNNLEDGYSFKRKVLRIEDENVNSVVMKNYINKLIRKKKWLPELDLNQRPID